MIERVSLRGWCAIRAGHNHRYPLWPDWESFSEDSESEARILADKEDAESEWSKAHPVLRIGRVEIREIDDD